MKKLLFLGLMFSLIPSAHAIYEIDIERGGVRVLCISDYVFVKYNEGGIIQVMQKSLDTSRVKARAIPLSCDEYIKMEDKKNKDS